MNTYIFLTGSISNMGGCQMYVNNKVRYLKAHEWHVVVYYFNRDGMIILDKLKPYEKNYIPELRYGYYYLSRKKRENILDRICTGITEGRCVVETHVLGLTFWGELLTQKIGAKHIVNCIEENIRQVSAKEAAFLKYKVLRNEVLNGSEKSYHRYFGMFFEKDFCKYSNKMVPVCDNVISEDNIKIDIEDADINCLSLGRLDKPYIQTMLHGIQRFIEANSGFSYNLHFIGGSPEGNVEQQIQKLFTCYQNVRLKFWGYMYPIPIALIRKADIAFATSNSVLVTAEQGIPTIVYDVKDYQTIGVYGYNTNNRLFREMEPIIPTEVLMRKILIEKVFPKTPPIKKDMGQIDKEFNLQIDFLEKSPQDGKAYDVMSIHSTPERFIAQIKRVLLVFVGKWIVS